MNDHRGERLMSDAERDACYTQLCQTLTVVGEAQAPLLLARLALLLMERLGNAQVASALIDNPAQDLLPKS